MLEGSTIDIIIHLATAAIALCLLALSYLSYRRAPRQRLLFVLGAFLIFALKEFLIALDVIYLTEPTLVFAAHVLDLLVLGLFFMGVARE